MHTIVSLTAMIPALISIALIEHIVWLNSVTRNLPEPKLDNYGDGW